MRVAYVCADPGVAAFGHKGGSVHVQEVLRALKRSGHRPHLFCARPEGEPSPGLEDVPVHPLPRIGRGRGAEREAQGRAANGPLGEALVANGPFDLVYERYSLWSRAGMAHARRTGIPGVLEVNAPLIEEQARHRTLVDVDGAEECARAAIGDATAVIAVSEPVAAWARARRGPGAAVHVVANGVDPERITVRPPSPPRDTFTVGFVGTLKPWHGVETLVDAMAILTQGLTRGLTQGLTRGPTRGPTRVLSGGRFRHDAPCRLLIVGDGPVAGALAARVARQGLEAITTFTGAVQPDEVVQHLHRMDVGVAPYPALADCYFSPLKVYEYMAAGVAVVASAIGQAAELIDPGRTGLLYPPGDVTALAATLARLGDDPVRRAELGRAGRAEVVAHHTWDQVVARTLALATGPGAVGAVA